MHDQDTARIPLRARDGSVRAYVTVDATDANWVNQWRWCLSAQGYAVRGVTVARGKRSIILLHRALLGLVEGDGLEGDHIDRDRLNCRRMNLRVVPKNGRANQQNTSSQRRSTSQYRGVSWDASAGKWVAGVKVNGRRQYLGYFTDETEAAEVARQARARLLPYAVD